MKNDFDFIKDKIDESGVKAPSHMNEGFVLHKLDGVQPAAAPDPAYTAQPQPKVVELKPKRRYGKVTAIAAAFVAVAVLGTALAVHFTKQPAAPAVSQTTGLIQFETREQVQEAIEKLSSRNARYTGYAVSDEEYGAAERDMNFAPAASPDGAASGSGGDSGKGAGSTGLSSAAPESHSETYKQVEGVDEGDIIKTDGRYIYVAEYSYSPDTYDDTSCVCVFPAKPGVTDPILRIVPGENYAKPAQQSTADEATPDESVKPAEPADTDIEPDDDDQDDRMYIREFFIKDGRLVILCSCYTGTSYGGVSYDDITRVYVYDAANMNNVTLLDTFTQSGSYTSSRMIGDVLYLVTNEYSVTGIPCCGRGETPDEMYPSCIYSVEDPYEESFLIVSSYDTLDRTASTDSKAVLGLGSDIYCSEDNLYIAAEDYSRYFRLYYDVDYKSYDGVLTYGADEDDEEEEEYKPKTKIFKVSLSDGIAFTAYGEVEGTTNNQYSFDEHDGYLRVATTSWNEDYEDINNLYVLDDSLNIVGSVTGFAEDESIKAVRYVGDTAYVITYEQTDPLFVIDLSSPSAPTILGEVKISGFSTMLVPVDENTILGLGINTGESDYTTMEVQNGFKLALFDVSDKAAPQVLDSRSYVDYSSEVMYNPRALVYNPERGDYLVPLSYYHYDYNYSDYDYMQSKYEQYGAVLNFRVEDGRLVETELYITDHDSIDRCVYVGDTIYMTYTDDNGAAHLDSVSYR